MQTPRFRLINLRMDQQTILLDAVAVALSMRVSHKNIFFDKKMPEVKFIS